MKAKKLPRQARARATFDAVVEAGAQVLMQEGYAAVTTNRVAEVAGVSIGSLYEYFPNKQAIVAEVIGRALREIVAEVSSGLHIALAQSRPREAIGYWMEAMTAALEKRQGVLRVALREVPFLWSIPEVRNLSDALQAIAQEGRARTEQAGTPNRVVFDDPEASTWLLMTMVWSAILQSVLYRPAHLSRERLTHTLVEMVLKLL